ncbi:MAG: phosphopantetheine-binding protein [Nitrospinota bacterium]|nr:phosphopantetheine-binding protein [Nitrospinota bacterium]MDH5677134.1 phosphopantetheine-binding protein [Nitrospinota bacterium]MDH5756208.1 phosphopantetheine-binding protein [Nitrospinota bacterium]
MPENSDRELAEIRRKIKEILVEGLSLEHWTPEEIKDDEILFGQGLDLDSLDAAEIAVLIQRNFNFIVGDPEQTREAFYSISTLAEYIYQNTQGQD